MKPETLLYRQVHYSKLVDGGVSFEAFLAGPNSTTFLPSKKDEGKLSVYDGDQYTPEASHKHYTTNRQSSGVLAVSCEECESLQLPRIADDETFAGHVLIDYTNHSKREVIDKAKILRDIAMQRNWLYIQPPQETTLQPATQEISDTPGGDPPAI